MIGVVLRTFRKRLNLTQTEMAGCIMGKSYYSKVENGIHEIKACDLLNILDLHGISIEEFYEELKKESSKDNINLLLDEWTVKLKETFYNHDISQLKQLIESFENIQYRNNKRVINLKAQALLIDAYLENKLYKFDNDKKEFIKKVLFEAEDWNKDNLQLLTIAIPIFDSNELNIIIRPLFVKYINKPRIFKENSREQLIVKIAVDYLEYAYHNTIGITQEVRYALKILDLQLETPENCFVKIVENYYRNIFKGNIVKAREILVFLSNNGMKGVVRNFKTKK